MIYKDMFSRLPERYRKINTEKIYEVLFGDYDNMVDTMEDIEGSRNIDNAFGASLNYLGGNVGLSRTNEDDEEFRKLLKIKIVANLSTGDIETINYVATALLGDEFIGLRESWQDAAYEDNAGLIANVKYNLGEIPITLERVKAGGVKLYWESTAVRHLIKIKRQLRIGESLYPLCNTIRAGTWWYMMNTGRGKKSYIDIENNIRNAEVKYPIAGKAIAKEGD